MYYTNGTKSKHHTSFAAYEKTITAGYSTIHNAIFLATESNKTIIHTNSMSTNSVIMNTANK